MSTFICILIIIFKIIFRELEGTITRTIIHGPTLHVPAADEWIHEFTWHGKDPKEPNNKARKVPGKKLIIIKKTV
jgi:hypothetical protein